MGIIFLLKTQMLSELIVADDLKTEMDVALLDLDDQVEFENDIELEDLDEEFEEEDAEELAVRWTPQQRLVTTRMNESRAAKLARWKKMEAHMKAKHLAFKKNSKQRPVSMRRLG